jgi:signal transduction histidine kinase
MSDRAPLDLKHRSALAAEALAYIWLSVALGLAGALVVSFVVTSATLSLFWLGLPLILLAIAVARRLAELERREANRFLDAQIPPLPRRSRRSGSLFRRVVDALADRWHWRVLGLMALRLPLALLALAAAVTPIVLTVELLVLAVRGIGGLDDHLVYVGPLTLNVATGILLLLLALPAAILSVAVEGLHVLLRSVARALLAPRSPADGPVREMLAESLGDRSVTIAYWIPDLDAFVDEAGHPVELPEPGSGRTWTAVDDAKGGRVAAIVHDAALDAGPELVQAAAMGAALAIDNERLKADLRARVEELRVSRIRIVEAGLSARQRIERDLHDGAQQHLVALAIEMGMLKNRLKGSENEPLVADMASKLQTALEELRELARGIHPAILTDRGLGPAIDALAARSPIPVEAEVELGEDRLSAPIEAAAYFVVAEALTNVAKYAQATHAIVRIDRAGEEVTVRVGDDGIGGASMDGGTGLRGMADRVRALGGRIGVESPGGGGTRIVATIPCDAAQLVVAANGPEGR